MLKGKSIIAFPFLIYLYTKHLIYNQNYLNQKSYTKELKSISC